ncbi:hypothetical protein NVP1246O_63 [Vibrio phage 1.246.O._10N.261.54.E10]|nr:hypothetical protein NVP1246O_63 [Vibrio phage 1.246.O._10N.261.54.E10]
MTTQSDGITLCKIIHGKMSGAGFYPALTGGLLYKEGSRKDVDIVIYRNRQQEKFELEAIEKQLEECGLYEFQHFGFVSKAKWRGVTVDLFNPETDIEFTTGEYSG